MSGIRVTSKFRVARWPKVGWLAAFDPKYLRAPSVLALIGANLIPLAGVLFWGWSLYGLMALYWMETGIIGFFAILQMAIAARWFAILMVPFFVVHFGGFMLGHLLFLTVLFGGGTGEIDEIPEQLHRLLFEDGFWLAFVALFGSHAVSFVMNTLRPTAPAAAGVRASPGDLMTGTYGRVIVLHVTLILGAALVAVTGTMAAAFVLLVVLKTAVDFAAHVRKNFAPDGGPREG